MKIGYTKKALTFTKQIEQLESRGLLIDDESRATHYLSHINYYRLSAYMYPYLKAKKLHLFKDGTKFQDILDLYNFDRELRLLILDAIERIEVSFRTSIIYNMSHQQNPFWVNDDSLFFNNQKYQDNLDKLKQELSRSNEEFLKHFKSKYKEEIPPSWITFEICSFGLLSQIFSNLKKIQDKKRIVKEYGLAVKTFESWFHTLAYVRNICAHHSRLWNRQLRIQPKLPDKKVKNWLDNQVGIKNNRMFVVITILLYLLNIINPTSHFKRKLYDLFDEYKNIDLAPMGFPKDWKEEELFKL